MQVAGSWIEIKEVWIIKGEFISAFRFSFSN